MRLLQQEQQINNNPTPTGQKGKHKMELKELRQKEGLSQPAMAKKLGVSHSAISQIESGKMKVSEKFAAKVKEVFGAEIAAETGKVVKAAKEVKAKAEKTIKRAAGKAKAATKKAAETKTEKAAEAKTEKAAKRTAGRAKKAAEKVAAEMKATEKAIEAKVTAAKKPRGKKAPKNEIILQSPTGSNITLEDILAKTGPVDEAYIRPDHNKIYWVRGEETGSIDLW